MASAMTQEITLNTTLQQMAFNQVIIQDLRKTINTLRANPAIRHPLDITELSIRKINKSQRKLADYIRKYESNAVNVWHDVTLELDDVPVNFNILVGSEDYTISRSF